MIMTLWSIVIVLIFIIAWIWKRRLGFLQVGLILNWLKKSESKSIRNTSQRLITVVWIYLLRGMNFGISPINQIEVLLGIYEEHYFFHLNHFKPWRNWGSRKNRYLHHSGQNWIDSRWRKRHRFVVRISIYFWQCLLFCHASDQRSIRIKPRLWVLPKDLHKRNFQPSWSAIITGFSHQI